MEPLNASQLNAALAPAMEVAAEQAALAGKPMEGQVSDVLSAMIKVIMGQGKELIDTPEERKAVAEEVVRIFGVLFPLGPIASFLALRGILISVVTAILERLAAS